MGIKRLYRRVKGIGASGEQSFEIVRVYGTEEELYDALEYLFAEFPEGVFTPGQPMAIHGIYTPNDAEDLNCIDILLVNGGKNGFAHHGSKPVRVDERADSDGTGDSDRGFSKASGVKKGRR